MGLRSDPIGGGQFKQAIKQIMEAESQPIRQLEGRKAREESRLKLFQEFKSKFAGIDRALSEISTFKKLRELKADLGDGATTVSVTLDKERAQPGTYQLQIEELAQRTSVMSNGFEDADEPVLGLGFIVMNLGNGDTAEVFVDDANSSLRGVAGLINAQPDSPIRAAVIKDSTDPDYPWKLILSSKKDGSTNGIEFPEFYFLDGSKDFYIDSDREARNALVYVDGFPIELESNDITDFLPGVNLHLKQAKPGQPFAITISEDYQKISGKIKAVVDQVNQVLSFITKQNQIDASSDTRSTFAGDTSLQTIEYRLRNMMHEGFPVPNGSGGFRVLHLSALGVEFDKTGQLAFKEDKFTKLMEKDFEGLSAVVSGEFGFAFQMRELVKSYTQVGSGLLNLREQGLKHRIKEIDTQIDNKARQLEKKQVALVDQFAKLEGSLANLQRQQQQLAASGFGGAGGNPIAQLMG
ncbi:MAG: flagellar filament capping protein FliD [Oligoflexia bacterium]|nr:flagellar filament capping protein FliD [Oligoflexia bacterium]